MDGGFLFYPWRWSRGYLVTEVEFRGLKAEYSNLLSWKRMGWLLLAMLGFSLVATISELTTGYDLLANPFIHIGFWVGIILPTLWSMLAPQRLVWGRNPIAPRLNRSEVLGREAHMHNWPFAIWLAAMSAWLTVIGVVVAMADPWIGVPMVLVFALALTRSALVILRKLKQGSSGAKQ